MNILLPKIQKALDKEEIDAQAAIGCPDSFISLGKKEVISCLSSIFEDSSHELSISFVRGKYQIDEVHTSKHLESGVLKSTLNPCEVIIKLPQKDVIKEFEYLLNRKSSERSLELFISKNYRLIFGEKYDRIETQLWLKYPEVDISGHNRRLDLFLRNSVERDWEIIELKGVKEYLKKYRNITTFTTEVYTAIQQLKNYRDILLQDTVKKKLAGEGIEYHFPEARIVFGKIPDIPTNQWRWLKTANEDRLRIITYDELLKEMKIRANTIDDIISQISMTNTNKK